MKPASSICNQSLRAPPRLNATQTTDSGNVRMRFWAHNGTRSMASLHPNAEIDFQLLFLEPGKYLMSLKNPQCENMGLELASRSGKQK